MASFRATNVTPRAQSTSLSIGYPNAAVVASLPTRFPVVSSIALPVAVPQLTSIAQVQQSPITSQPRAVTKDETSYKPQGDRDISYLTCDSQLRRRSKLEFDREPLKSFVADLEFVSVGSWCGVSRSVQAVGLKRQTYPFDWIRSPVDGILHLLDTNFSDFLTYTSTHQHGDCTVYASARWGGSFWHHDPSSLEAKEEFTRRIERFLGMREDEVKSTNPRLFIRAANSTRELDATLRLYEKLKSMLPSAKVYLLVIIELQSRSGPIRVRGSAFENIVFQRIGQSSFEDDSKYWSMEKTCDAYAAALASACKIFAKSSLAKVAVKEVPDLESLIAECDQYDAGSPSRELFNPRRFKAQALNIRSLRRQQDAHKQCVLAPCDNSEDPQSATSLLAKSSHPPPRVSQPTSAGSGNVQLHPAFSHPVALMAPLVVGERRSHRMSPHQGLSSPRSCHLGSESPWKMQVLQSLERASSQGSTTPGPSPAATPLSQP